MFGVYLPYYKGTSEQIQDYSETLVILQSKPDTMQTSPVLIVRDINTILPQQRDIATRWHISHILSIQTVTYYMIKKNNNDLIVAEFSFE